MLIHLYTFWPLSTGDRLLLQQIRRRGQARSSDRTDLTKHSHYTFLSNKIAHFLRTSIIYNPPIQLYFIQYKPYPFWSSLISQLQQYACFVLAFRILTLPFSIRPIRLHSVNAHNTFSTCGLVRESPFRSEYFILLLLHNLFYANWFYFSMHNLSYIMNDANQLPHLKEGHIEGHLGLISSSATTVAAGALLVVARPNMTKPPHYPFLNAKIATLYRHK